MVVPARGVRVVRALLVTLILAASLVAGAELALRGLYAWAFWSTERSPLVYERLYWAVPPWVARTSVLYEDPELGLWMTPNATRTYLNLFGPIGDLADVGRLFQSLFPEMPAWARDRPLWHLRTNSSGLRGDDLPTTPVHDTYRVAVLGDSWTVGVNVENEDTFVAQLATRLADAAAPRGVEVLNFGVIGGRAESGLRLLPRVLALEPDLVILAYAQNDEAESARPDRPRRSTAPAAPSSRPWTWRAMLSRLELYQLWTWWNSPEGDRIEAALRKELTRPRLAPNNEPGRHCPNPDVTATSYHATMEANVRTLAAAGVPVVLLYDSVPNFSSHCTLRSLQRIARTHGLPLIDASTVLEREERRLAREREDRLDLAGAPVAGRCAPTAYCVLLRVEASADARGRSLFVMGNRPEIGGFVPNTVPLFDDGTHGDQHPGDGVWSRLVAFPMPGVLTYAFTDGDPGTWTGLENYRLRAFELRAAHAGRAVAVPIAHFGSHDLRSDASHPDALGHRAIAEALLPAVQASASFVTFTSGPDTSGSGGVATGR